MKPQAYALTPHQALVVTVQEGQPTAQLLSVAGQSVYLTTPALVALRDTLLQYLPIDNSGAVEALQHRVRSLQSAMHQAATDLCMLDDRNGVAERVGQYLVDQAGDPA